MRRSLSILAVCVVFLASCQHFQDPRPGLEGFNPRVVRQPQPLLPNVFVTASGYLVVDQEPIRIGKGDIRDGRVTVSWALAAGSPQTFPANCIVIGPGSNKDQDRPVDVKCGVQGTPQKVFECSFKAVPGRSKYKYTVNVREGDRRLEALDPYMETNL